jgi:pyroglutamyl-peptidase
MLLTTFAPWRAHQVSNAADDLIAALQHRQGLPPQAVVMRHIPVSFELAPIRVLAKVVELKPEVVVCCGMAEGRTHLNLERYGRRENLAISTQLPLDALLADTHLTTISDCAGTYVCNHLYYRVLGAIADYPWPVQALFVHISTADPGDPTALSLRSGADFAAVGDSCWLRRQRRPVRGLLRNRSKLPTLAQRQPFCRS